jgi:cysteinyl-tRNA synthetase
MPNIQPITLFDSYQKQNFTLNSDNTVTAGVIKLYSCGPTVYSIQHIGNMRAAWFGDTLAKLAKLAGWQLEWVLNITDVGHLVSDGDSGEDKIEKGAKKEGKTAEEVVDFYLNDYLRQASLLGLDLPAGKMRPKATEYIEEQMILALGLLQQGLAYLLEDGIYYDSKANRGVLEAVEGSPGMPKTEGDNDFTGREIENTQKNPADFALWKFVNEKSLQKWQFQDFSRAVKILEQSSLDLTKGFSPFPQEDLAAKWGCPGWHSECVTMISQLLGQRRFSAAKFSFAAPESKPEIDIHTGGIEHIPVHHKNEILQSEALGFHLSKHWVHFEHLLVDGGKMSKSLGNTYTIHDIIQRGFDPLAFKLMLFEHNYQDQMNFTWEKLQQSQARLFNLRKNAAQIQFKYFDSVAKSHKIEDDEDGAGAKLIIKDLLITGLDNLDMAKMFEEYQIYLEQTLHETNSSDNFPAYKKDGLMMVDKNLWDLKIFPLTEIPEKVLDLAQNRLEFKRQKNYAKADELRKEAADLGWQIDDYAWGFGIWWNPTLKV